MQKRVNQTPREDVEQTHLFEWAAYMSGKYPELELMHHIPNGGRRDKVTAGKLKAQGVKAGIPDIFLPVPRGGRMGLYIELKREQGGKLSKAQKEVIPLLYAQGYEVAVCKGFEEAKADIEKYLSLPRTVIVETVCEKCIFFFYGECLVDDIKEYEIARSVNDFCSLARKKGEEKQCKD